MLLKLFSMFINIDTNFLEFLQKKIDLSKKIDSKEKSNTHFFDHKYGKKSGF